MHVLRLVPLALVSLGMLGCGNMFGPGNLDQKDLTDRERAVKVYHQGQKPECEHEELGTVEAVSGSSTSAGTYDSSLAKMRRDAAALGATAIIVLDHSKDGMADNATGMAIRCKPK